MNDYEYLKEMSRCFLEKSKCGDDEPEGSFLVSMSFASAKKIAKRVDEIAEKIKKMEGDSDD
jgi:hypothetical protein